MDSAAAVIDAYRLRQERIGQFLHKIRPILWLWPVVAIGLSIFGSNNLQAIGAGLILAYLFLYVVLIMLDRPPQCQKGHTDIGYYYGRWSCRVCYRLERQRVSRRAKRHKV